MQLIASGGGNILLLRDLGRNDAGLLVAGYWMFRAPSACRHSFSGGTSFSVGVLDNEILNFEF